MLSTVRSFIAAMVFRISGSDFVSSNLPIKYLFSNPSFSYDIFTLYMSASWSNTLGRDSLSNLYHLGTFTEMLCCNLCCAGAEATS